MTIHVLNDRITYIYKGEHTTHMIDSLIINIFIVLLFTIILFYKARFRFASLDITLINRGDTDVIRGIAALLVMFSHYDTYVLKGNYLSSLGPAAIFLWTGGLGVCVFFFLSGYGLWLSYSQKTLDYHFLTSRFLKIVPSFVILRFLTGLPMFYQDGRDVIYILLYCLNIVDTSWFITEILIVYALFYLALKISRLDTGTDSSADRASGRAILYMGIFLFVMSLVFFLLDFNERWYNANFLFIVGLLAAKYWHKIMKLYSRAYYPVLLLSFLIFLGSGVSFTYLKGESILSPVFKTVSGIAFCLMLVGINMVIDWHPGLFSRLGSASLYIYIIHMNIWTEYTGVLDRINISSRYIASSLLSIFLSLLLVKIERRFRSIPKKL